MKKIKLFAVVVSSLISFSASAAAPCKAYVKLDLGYGLSSGTRSAGDALNYKDQKFGTLQLSIPAYKDNRGMIGSVGVGYAFNDAMRGEVSLDFKPKMKYYDQSSLLVESSERGGSAKLIYDFNNNTPVTPFIFGGIGATNVTPTLKPFALTTDSTSNTTSKLAIVQIKNDDFVKDRANNPVLNDSLKMKSKNVMTYQVGFGLSFKGSDSVSVDLAYGLGSKAKTTVATDAGTLWYKTKTDGGSSPVQIIPEESVLHKQLNLKDSLDHFVTLGVRVTL